jgi:hypothetical protein
MVMSNWTKLTFPNVITIIILKLSYLIQQKDAQNNNIITKAVVLMLIYIIYV